MDMIATKHDPVTFSDLDAAGFPSGIEAIDVVRPNSVVFDVDAPAVAFDADLPVVMDVAGAHATAGSNADPGTTVQTNIAVFDGPSGTFPGVDRTLLSGTRELLDRHVTDRHVGCRAFERK